jgi:glycosyltransferase involved in cell wall biosynthesis
LTGVQRFATEITRALGALPAWRAQDAVLLAPAGTADPGFPGFRFQTAGRHKGHLWEQWDLGRATRDGLLVNLGNTGPLRHRRQLVVIHDAGVFSTAGSYSLPFRIWYRILHRRLAKRAKLVTVSAFAQGDLASHLGIDPAKIAVISEGAEHILRPTADPSVLAAHGLTAGRYALVVGSLAPHKNLAALSATAAALAERGIQLAITGGLDANVFASGSPPLPRPATYLGRVDDAQLRALYESAACFIFPSRYEGFGLPAVEAMACGCPIAAAKAGSLPEICEDAAVYFDPADPADIAEIVTRLVDAPALGAELRRKGRLRVRRFTWKAAAERLAQLVEAS